MTESDGISGNDWETALKAKEESQEQKTNETSAVLLQDRDTVEQEEFIQAKKATRLLEQWARSLPLAQLLADCFTRYAEQEALLEISILSEEQIQKSAESFKIGLIKIIKEEVRRMHECIDTEIIPEKADSGSDVTEKFVVNCVSESRWGTSDDFFKGLSSRIGTGPMLSTQYSGPHEHSVLQGMRMQTFTRR
jgi:hypothetical protein